MPNIPGIAPVSGPLLFAILFNWGLQGVLIVQVYLYSVSFPKDFWVVKGAVVVMFLLEVLQTILLTKSEFLAMAISFGNPEGLDVVDLIWFSVPMLSGMVASISQGFYAYRLWAITRSKVLVGIIALLSLVQLGGALAEGVVNKNAFLFSRLFSNNSTSSFISTGIWEATSAVCDVLIAIFMTVNLRTKTSGFKQTQVLLSRIIRLTIQTGTFTAVVAITVLALVFLPGHPTYYQAAVAVLGKAYSNSMMVTLNSRIQVISDHKIAWNEQTITRDAPTEVLRHPNEGSLRFAYPDDPAVNSRNAAMWARRGLSVNTRSYTHPPGAVYNDF